MGDVLALGTAEPGQLLGRCPGGSGRIGKFAKKMQTLWELWEIGGKKTANPPLEDGHIWEGCIFNKEWHMVLQAMEWIGIAGDGQSTSSGLSLVCCRVQSPGKPLKKNQFSSPRFWSFQFSFCFH